MATVQPAQPAITTAAVPADPPRPIRRELRRPALVAGVGLLVLAVLAAAATFGAVQRLVTAGDAARTADALTASAGWFRLGIAALVTGALLDVVVAWALRAFFEPVDQGLATLAAWLRLGYAATFAVAISQLAGVLPLLTDAVRWRALTLDQRQAEALLKVQAYQDVWHVGLALFGLHLVLIGYLAWRSGYVPRVLGALIALAGGGYLVDTFAGLLVASSSVSVSAFTFVGEALLIPWLLVRGRRVAVKC